MFNYSIILLKLEMCHFCGNLPCQKYKKWEHWHRPQRILNLQDTQIHFANNFNPKTWRGYHYLGLWIYEGSLVAQDLSNIDFILLGSQVKWSQTRLKVQKQRNTVKHTNDRRVLNTVEFDWDGLKWSRLRLNDRFAHHGNEAQKKNNHQNNRVLDKQILFV